VIRPARPSLAEVPLADLSFHKYAQPSQFSVQPALNRSDMKKSKIHIIAVAYKRIGELKVFVQSVLNQTSNHWELTIIHDGPCKEFQHAMEAFQNEAGDKIEYFTTDLRYNDYGHSLREIGLKNIKCDYVLLTNADNYLIPKAIEYLTSALEKNPADVVIFDMVHRHDRPGGRPLPPYSFFQTRFQRYSIDMGAAIVKRHLAEKAGFRDKSFAGDATYFEDVVRAAGEKTISIHKVSSILFVHN
jgi:hypothetical protein